MEFKQINMTDLPTPPHSLLAVIRYCSEEQADTEKLAALIRIDPLLSTELLRIANSAWFGVGNKLSSMSRVTVRLGMKAVRSLSLGIALKGLGADNQIPGFNDNLFWEDAIRRAAIASVLGEHMRLDTDECFTAGLLQDIGLLILLSQDHSDSDFISNYRRFNPDIRKLLEREAFGSSHDQVASYLANEWCLPDELVEAISKHHDKPGNDKSMSDLLYCTDWLNHMFVQNNDHQVFAHCQILLAERLGFDSGEAEKILSMMPETISGIAKAFGHTIDMKDWDMEALLNETASKLVEHNIELQELTLRLTRSIEERDRLASELKRDIEIAKEVQRALLPSPAQNSPVHAFNISARELSGDFYDFQELDDGRLCFCLGDVSGKGVFSSILMVKASSMYRSLCETITDQVELANILNNEICRIAVRGMFVTMVIGIYNRADGKVELVNAGHLPVLLFDENGNATSRSSSSPPFGVMPDAVYEKEMLDLGTSSLYLYSDGITETPISDKRMLGVDGLTMLLKKISEEPAEKQVRRMQKHFQSKKEHLHDDSTLLLLQGCGPASSAVCLPPQDDTAGISKSAMN